MVGAIVGRRTTSCANLRRTRERLSVIHDIREQQWLASLPAAVRARPELVRKWKDEEALRRDRWAFIRQQAEAFAANKSPWPFDTEAGRKAVIDFARTTFKLDDLNPRHRRLTSEEFSEYNRTLQLAQRENSWAWYGLLVYELARLHPYLPDSDNSKLMIRDPNDLPEPYAAQ